VPPHLARLADALHRAGLILAIALTGCDREPAARRHEAPTVRETVDVVWSASSFIRVVRGDRVVGGIDLHKTVTSFAFDAQHGHVFAAASDGVHVFDDERGRGSRRLTESPARQIRIANGRLWILEHDVSPGPDGVPVSSPYRLREIDLATLETRANAEVGERVLAFAPPLPGKRVLLASESGLLRAIEWPSASGEPLDPPGTGRLREWVALSPDASHAYLGVEGPAAAILDFDLATMSRHVIPLGREAAIRGLAVRPDGRALFVDALRSVARVELRAGTTAWAPLDGPHQDVAVSTDGRRLWLAKPVHEEGGALTVLDAESLALVRRVTLSDISPFVVAVSH